MEYNKVFFEKVFSDKRMERYFALYPDNEDKAIKHYQSNLQLTEAFYTSLSVLEVALRNALSRELETMTGREDWYAVFPNTLCTDGQPCQPAACRLPDSLPCKNLIFS